MKYNSESNYFCHCQMDYDGLFDKEYRDRNKFETLNDLIKRFDYWIKDKSLLSVLIREENDKTLKHKVLIYNNELVICSFDYEFNDELPTCNTDIKILSKSINNGNVFMMYSKWALKRFKKYGTLYINKKIK